MNDLENSSPFEQRLSETEIRRLSAAERTAILEGQAALAKGLYRREPQLSGLEAFGEDDLLGDGPFTEKG